MKIKAQSTLEYALVLGIVLVALLSMQLYFRRGIQAAIKVTADVIGDQADAEDIDLQKGTKLDSQIQSFTGGSAGGPATDRTVTGEDGVITYSVDRKQTRDGWSTYVSESEE